MRILAISGSLRDGSYNSLLLRAAEQQAPAGVAIDRYDGLAQVPPFHGNRSAIGPVPEPVRDFQERIARADAVLIATPEYNGSIPGQLKNAFDWVSRPPGQTPLRGKPAAVLGASTSLFGAVWAQAELRKVLSTIGARVVDRELPIPQALEALGEDGLPRDAAAREVMRGTLDELLELARSVPVAA